MRFGSREICNVVFKAKTNQKIGKTTFVAGQPVLYIDSATASSLEGSAEQTYAQGGRGNSRLITWEGDKTLTFSVTDALLSPIGFSILSGAGLFQGETKQKVHVPMSHYASISKSVVTESGTSTPIYFIDVDEYAGTDKVLGDAPFYAVTASGGSIDGLIIGGLTVKNTAKDSTGRVVDNIDPEKVYTYENSITIDPDTFTVGDDDDAEIENYVGKQVFVSYYIEKGSDVVTELQIDAEHFAGNYYVEAETLFRREDNGYDMPAIITLPNVKIQSNFTFSMSSSGDPSKTNCLAA